MYALLLSTAVIFVAELGDKSQLMAMTFATRYRARDVIIGITVATAIVHLASVAIGAAIGEAFGDYQPAINIAAGLAFLFFAAWTLRGDELSDEEADKARTSQGDRRNRRPVTRTSPRGRRPRWRRAAHARSAPARGQAAG